MTRANQSQFTLKTLCRAASRAGRITGGEGDDEEVDSAPSAESGRLAAHLPLLVLSCESVDELPRCR